MPKNNRRAFIRKLLTGIAGFLLFPGRILLAAVEAKWVSVGTINAFPLNMPILIKRKIPAGKPGKKKSLSLFIIRGEDGVRAMSAKCTHKGCIVKARTDGSYVCPCHNARFSAEGKVLKGPAKRPLPWYKTRVTPTGDVEVDPGK